MLHMSKVECHLCRAYFGKLKMASPVMMFAISAGTETQVQIHAKTVIHPIAVRNHELIGIVPDGGLNIPCINPKNLFHTGASVADQRY